ncbi:MAG: hypothetical protein CMK09_17480 [Ponticaulis sp.]|nr:hypothetical protein [Ponticaulis sp.]
MVLRLKPVLISTAFLFLAWAAAILFGFSVAEDAGGLCTIYGSFLFALYGLTVSVWQPGVKRALMFASLTAVLPVCAGIAVSLVTYNAWYDTVDYYPGFTEQIYMVFASLLDISVVSAVLLLKGLLWIWRKLDFQ